MSIRLDALVSAASLLERKKMLGVRFSYTERPSFTDFSSACATMSALSACKASPEGPRCAAFDGDSIALSG